MVRVSPAEVRASGFLCVMRSLHQELADRPQRHLAVIRHQQLLRVATPPHDVIALNLKCRIHRWVVQQV